VRRERVSFDLLRAFTGGRHATMVAASSDASGVVAVQAGSPLMASD
jgi:hypothetical protein